MNRQLRVSFSIAVAGCGSSSPAVPLSELDQAAHNLAVIHSESGVPHDQTTAKFRRILKSLDEKCTQGPSAISDYIVVTQRGLAESGTQYDLIVVAEQLDQATVKDLNTDCATNAAMLGVVMEAE